MFLSHSPWLCILLPTLIVATPQNNTADASQLSLPGKFQNRIPDCAQPCLLASLAEQFPLACTVPSSLDCLCSTYSTGGQSLGEIALGCLYSSCSSVGREADEAYNICLGQTDAVKPTLTALTVMAATSASTSTPVVSTQSRTTTFNTISSPVPTETVNADSVSSTPTPTATSSPTQSSLASAAGQPQTMKPAQIVGLSVAAASAFIIAIGLIFLSIFLRKRRERRKEMELDEKSGVHSPRPDDPSHFAQSFERSRSLPELPIAQFPMPPTSVHQATNTRTGSPFGRDKDIGRLPQPSRHQAIGSNVRPNIMPAKSHESVHPLFRQSPTHPETIPNSKSPSNQIGLAVSAEIPEEHSKTGAPWHHSDKHNSREFAKLGPARMSRTLQRPNSAVTQCTVFEEDDVSDAHESRVQSALLPAFSIPPIRNLQPSRAPPPRFNLERSPPDKRSELSLHIPPRQSIQPSTTPEAHSSVMISSESLTSQAATTSDTYSNEDIPDYYFAPYVSSKVHAQTGSPQGPGERTKTFNTKNILSSSTVSRATSRASTNISESMSSRTSFESGVSDDPTPEEEDHKRLSPVAESPISNLRYPKIPRATNQLVPRSPVSPHSQTSRDSFRWPSEPSSLLVKRLGEQGALKIGSPLQTNRPTRSQASDHTRSNSMDVLSPTRASERSVRTQSGLWPPRSPAMYEPSVIRPLSIRPKANPLQSRGQAMEALKSPAWSNLTPTRQGEDLLLSVSYSKAKSR